MPRRPLDPAQVETDKIVEKIEKQLSKEYAQAHKEVTEKFETYMKRFDKNDEAWKKLVEQGKKTPKEYAEWRERQMFTGRRWEAMKDTLAQDYTNVHNIAEKIVNGNTADVYALGHNYGTYLIENKAQIDTSYTLYNHDTVERMWRDNPKLYHDPGKETARKIRNGEVKRWNRQKIQSVLTQGVLQGESIPNLTKRLQRVTGQDLAFAQRDARTMMTGVQNAGRLDSFKRAEKLGIKNKKVWIASLDGRTRHWHIELDGVAEENDEPFINEYGEIMYPGDPGADGANVYNCRCALNTQIEGHEIDTSDLNLRRNNKLEGMSYDEWKNWRKQEEHTPQAATGTWVDRVEQIRQRIKDNGGVITEKDLHDAGELLAKEVADYKEDKRIEKERAEQAFEKYKEETGYNELRQKKAELDKLWRNPGDRNIVDIIDETQVVDEKLEEIRKSDEFRKLMSAATNAKIDYQGTRKENADWLTNKLSEVRQMGSAGLDVTGHLMNSRSPMRKVVEEGYSHYPRTWVEKSIDRGRLDVRKVNRGYYLDRIKICISGYDHGSQFETAIHELGHRMEYTIPGIKEAEKEFYSRRTAGEPLKWLGSGYRKSEVTRKDDFIHPYMGKDYNDRAYELVSMGFEYAYTDPLTLAGDKDMESWIYGLLILE